MHDDREGGRSRRWGRALLLSLGTAACGIGAGPDGSEQLVRERYTPPTVYVSWWAQMRECSGLAGSFGDLRFFTVVSPVILRGAEFPCGGGQYCNGTWEAPHDITIAPAYTASERLIKHEMLHDLLRDPGHPAAFDECDVVWSGNDGFYAGDPSHRP